MKKGPPQATGYLPWSRRLLRLTFAVSSLQDQQTLLDELLRQAVDATSAAGGSVWLREEGTSVLALKASINWLNPPDGVERWVDEHAQAVLHTAKPHVSLHPYAKVPDGQPASLVIRAGGQTPYEVLAIPMIAASRCLGVIAVMSHSPEESFTADHFEALSVMASQVAMSLEGARLFSRVEQGKKEWEATFDAIGDSVLLLGLDGKILRANHAATRNSGLGFKELVGRQCYEVLHGTRQMFEQCPLLGVKETHYPTSAEVTDRDGSRILSVSAYPIFDVKGEIQAVVEHVRDVTQIKQAQARLVQAEKLSALGELVAGVAHELNNPLTSIVGFAQLLQRADLPEDDRTYLNTIYHESKRAARIVRSLLTFARRQEPEKRMLDLNEILNETLALMAYQLRAAGVRIEKSFDVDLPETAADPYQLQQVFMNIINNAQQAVIESHQGGTLTIRTMTVLRPAGYSRDSSLAARSTPESTQETWLRIEFADDGPGIPPGLLGRIFDPFFTTKKQGKGTGLGLSVCHGILRDHEGHIWAESVPGAGATFIAELPVRTACGTGTVPAETAKAPQLPPGRVLVIDDEEANLHLMRELLARHGQAVDTVPDATAALDKIANNEYDAILCDLRMPGMSGDDLYAEVKKRWPEVAEHWIFLTGDLASTRTRGFLEEVGRPVVEKPFEMAGLIRAIRRVHRLAEE